MSKLKKQSEKLLRAIEFESAPLSTDKGRFLRNDHCPNKVNSKKRRHRGWVTARVVGLDKYSQMFADANEPQIFWDDWADSRDGMRYDADRSHIRNPNMFHQQQCRNCRPTCHLWDTCEYKDETNPIKIMNYKLLKHEQIRKAKKEKRKRSLELDY
jgi:hypothetical protein